jgi:hypothetical protein
METRRLVQALYFSYGSNLALARMQERVPSAVALSRARLPGHRLTTDKRGRDGSGKANLRPDPAAAVWGVVYRFLAAHWPALDACEPGYRRVAVEVLLESGEGLGVQTYVSSLRAPDPVPLAWYKRLIVDGAREHRLPAAYLAMLEALPVRPDPAHRG